MRLQPLPEGSSRGCPKTNPPPLTARPHPALGANPSPEVTRSILPTSLEYLAPLTRAYSARSPDAVLGTDRL